MVVLHLYSLPGWGERKREPAQKGSTVLEPVELHVPDYMLKNLLKPLCEEHHSVLIVQPIKKKRMLISILDAITVNPLFSFIFFQLHDCHDFLF